MDIKLLPHQWEFLHSDEKFTLLCGGIGSGKSFAGSHYVINKCILDGKGLGLICANTYKQLRNSTLACLFRELDLLGIPFEYIENKGHLNIAGSKILALSLENYDYLRGMEISWYWADEVRDTKEDAFLVLIGRLRDKRAKLQGRLTTSPDGYNWLYDYFAGEKKTKDFKLINADSRSNTYLPEDYITSLMDAYDEKMIQQEIEGKFVNLTSGNVYYAFKRDEHILDFKQPNTLPKVGCDFNVNPITAVLGYFENETFFIYDEIYIKNSNTFELAKTIKEKWGYCDVFPDATGKARKTSATKTDHEILREAGLSLMYNPNPHVKDRQNCVNGLLGHNRIKIHPRCKMLIKDLEQLQHENKDDMLSHISDALGYLCWGLAPLRRPQAQNRTLNL